MFLKGFHVAGGTALDPSAGKEGSLLGSEAPGRESQQGVVLACEKLRWRLACRRRPLANRTRKFLVVCIHL